MKIGIIGGSGWMGAPIVHGLITKQVISGLNCWVSNRSGSYDAFNIYPDLNLTTNNQMLCDECDIIILSVRPQQFAELQINAQHALIISVMAGVSMQYIVEKTGSNRIVRSMPNAACERYESYTPWVASSSATAEDKKWVKTILHCIGNEDELKNENELAYFTALTGSAQGTLAYFANSMIEAAIRHGIDKHIAEKSIRQVFKGLGPLIGAEQRSPAETINLKIEYAGTTAALLLDLEQSNLKSIIAHAIDVSYQRAKSDMTSG